MSEIQSYFETKTIFLTGATGFLGKLLLEKLLRSCTNLKKIYVLLREKKGLKPLERLNKLFDIPAYDNLKKQYPNFIEKIVIVNGDLEKPYLGLSKCDVIDLQENVQIVFHCGANVRFDETLKKVGNANLRATKYLLEICRKAEKLESFVYVSTAFCNCYKQHVEERVYDQCLNPDTFLNIIDNFDDETLEKITPIILKDLPNTYILSKGTTEKLIFQEGQGLPISIVRPSIVISSFNEPLKGWTDNYYAATGLFVAGGLGLLRTIHGIKELKADLIPVDFVVNNIIVAAWDTHKRNVPFERNELKVFACASGNRNPITWDEYCTQVSEYGCKIPPTSLIWYPFGGFVKSQLMYTLRMFFLQTIPFLLIDLILILILKKPIMLKVDKKLRKFVNAISYFTHKEWTFDDRNTKQLYDNLSEIDKELFPFDIEKMKWDDYLRGYTTGIRIYLLKDPMDTVPAGKRKYKIMCVIHYMTVIIVSYCFYKFILFVYTKF